MKKDKKEIRDLLLGKAVQDDDGKLVTPESGTFRLPMGIVDGASTVRFLGIRENRRFYKSELSEKELMAEAEKCMRDIGRGVHLRQQPDAVACLIRYVLTRPVILVFRIEDDCGILSAWAGRSLMGRISRLRAIHAFEKPLADVLRITEVGPATPPEEKKTRKGRRAAKAEEAEEEAPAPEEQAGEQQYDEQYDEEYDEEYDEQYDEEYGEQYDGEYSGQQNEENAGPIEEEETKQ